MSQALDPEAGADLIPVVAIIGPTATGKTALSLALAGSVMAEVVSADSRQIYCSMDIGTAKPSTAEQAILRHHLIDVVDPDETLGLSQYLALARAAIQAIHERGALPFLVGGTGQYIRALLQGWQTPEVPPHPELRREIEARAQANPDAVWQELLALDPDAASFIDRRNVRRVVRALEVGLITGRPFSEQRRRVPPPYRVLQIGLTCERSTLYARADARVDAMMAAGLEREVAGLLERGYGWELPSMSALGYSQFGPYFAGEATLAAVSERIKLDTHAFIRRQYAWFSTAARDIVWLDITKRDYAERARELVAGFYT